MKANLLHVTFHFLLPSPLETRYQELRHTVKRTFYCLASLIIVSIFTGCSTVQIHDGIDTGPLLEPRTFHFKDGGKANFYSFDIGTPSRDDPLFFFISGSGCASVKYRFPFYFFPIMDLINARVMVLQKRNLEENSRGGRCSKAFTATDYFKQSVADQEEFIRNQLAKQPGNPKAIVLIGASEGAVVAAKVTSREPKITHIALIGSGGDTVRKNLHLLSKKKWYFFGLQGKLEAIEKNPHSVRHRAWGQTYRYWSSLLDVNIGDLLLSLNIPIIIAMGEDDDSVPIETALTLKKRFIHQGKNNLTLLIFPHANHHLQDLSTSRNYSKEFLESIAYCLRSTPEKSSLNTQCTMPEKLRKWTVF